MKKELYIYLASEKTLIETILNAVDIKTISEETKHNGIFAYKITYECSSAKQEADVDHLLGYALKIHHNQ